MCPPTPQMDIIFRDSVVYRLGLNIIHILLFF